MALLDNGAQINTIRPGFVESHSLKVGPVNDLVGRWVIHVGLGNVFIPPLGYVIIRVQMDGVQGYDKDQIALVIMDLSNFVVQVPIILGTPNISHIVNVMKGEGDRCPGNALGKCTSGPSPISSTSYSHSWRWPSQWEVKTSEDMIR